MTKGAIHQIIKGEAFRIGFVKYYKRGVIYD